MIRTPAACLAALALACASRHAAPSAGGGGKEAPAPAAPGIDASIVDRSVSPCVDFYAFACNGWLAKTPIPADRSRWTRSFDVMREQNEARLHELLDAAVARGADPADRYGGLVTELYAGCMDEAQADRDGLARLADRWRALDGVKDPATLAAAVGRLHASGTFPLFFVTSAQDAKDATQVIADVNQGGLSLPDRDYYTKDDAKSVAIRRDFAAHVERELSLAGESPDAARRQAEAILALETAMAGSQWTRVERRDPYNTYHRLDLAGLERTSPRFDWPGYLAALGAPGVTAFNAQAPRALERIDALLASTPPETWRAYLRWHVLARAAALRALPRTMSEEAFWFGARHFTGEQEMPARWKHCVETTDALAGEALGQWFARRWFPPDAKAQAVSLVGGIRAAMGERLGGLGWMDEPTRGRARAKLGAVVDKIGYPERWRSYEGLEARRGDWLGSATAASAFEVRRRLAQIGEPVDRSEWRMTPPTVNAYYSPKLNEIVFPAGILQPPFYTQGANDAVNHGAIGLVVGHELTHGFDDQGRKFDARGNLADSWTAPVGAEFERRAACVDRQYSDYVAIDDVRVNGKLTLGENIADLGGLALSHAAYRASRAGRGPEAPVAGFGPEQQFFLAHAQAWCQQIRPENARLRALTDPHSPARWRVNGPLSNLPAFAEAFGCKAGDPMVRAERCAVW